MQRTKRVKRASVGDLYKSCALGGDCLPDVKNKVEGTTLADVLLKAFGSILYLGGLGIGTGRGSGGQFGYRPFGTPSRPTGGTLPVRPNIPLDTLGPAEVVPVDPLGPAIVPLSEGLPDSAVIDIPGAGPGLPSETLDVTTSIDGVSEVTGVGEHPAVTYNTNDVAQIDIQIQPPPPKRVFLDPEVYNTNTIVDTHASHVDSDFNVFVDAQMDSVNVGNVENIELQVLNSRAEFEIEEGPVTSTPLSTRIISRARDLYNRYTLQVPTRQVLGATTSRVTFEFENPAFEDDIADAFREEVANVADMANFSNLQTLSDIRFSEPDPGTVRVSRLGQRAGMTTRSGLQIGERVHFYYDLSPIPKESVELRTFGEYSNESTLVDELEESFIINPFEQPIEGTNEFSDNILLDTYNENFSNVHIQVSATTEDGDTFEIPTIPPGVSIKVFSDDYGKGLVVSSSATSASSVIVPNSPYIPLIPSFSIEFSTSDFDLHPSLLPRKRKRSFL